MPTKIFLLSLIVILASFLRIFSLSSYPLSLYGDEHSFAWNAWNILKTGTDEYGTPYPLQFRAFDDYKSPIPVYLLVPIFSLFGMNTQTIRLPVSISGVLTVVGIYLLSRRFLNARGSLLISFVLAVSPWHVHLTRGYFEAAISLLFTVFGIYFFLGKRYKDMVFASLFFALSIYSYFTPRIYLLVLIPLLILLKIKKEKNYLIKPIFVFISVLFLISFPLIYETVFHKGLSRFNKLSGSFSTVVSTAVASERYISNLPPNITSRLVNKYTVGARIIVQNYIEHFSFDFLFVNADTSLRYFLGGRGVMYLFELPFLILGIYFLAIRNKKAFFLALSILLTTSIPTALVGRPFALRSLPMVVGYSLLVGYGIYVFIKKGTSSFHIIKSGAVTLVVCFSLLNVLTQYYFFYPKKGLTWWGGENYLEITQAKKEYDKYEYIFLSDYYTGLPLALGVYNTIDPLEYRHAFENPIILADGRKFVKIGKFYIGSLDINKDRLTKNMIPPKSLYFARPEEAESGETINAPDDGRVLFYVYRT